MNPGRCPVWAALVFLSANAWAAGPVAVNPASYYPEGPLWHAGRLYYAEMTRDRVMIWDGRANRVFWRDKDCGPTSVAPYGAGLLVLCHRGQRLVALSASGRPLAAFEGPRTRNPNDSVADGAGGVYFTSSGEFDRRAPATGAVIHLAPDGRLRRLAAGIRYANGITRRGDHLYVSEHLGRRVLRFAIRSDGSLAGREIWFDLDRDAPKAPGAHPYAGPDGLEFDRRGNLYIAEYGAGRVLVVDPGGRLVKIIPVPGKFVTNLAFDADGRALYITAPDSITTPPYRGRVWRLSEPKTP